MSAADTPSLVPARLAEWQGTERYAVRRFLGAGSMGTVYEAFDRDRAQPVALKRLRHFSPAALYLFKQEFRALVDVSHPNLVRLHELVATDPHDMFFSMELVRGGELLDYVRAKDGVHPERLRSALRQLVEGVQALHAAGKLHRDIKPSNVLVTQEGRVVLLDFGVATEIAGAPDRDPGDEGAIVGTAAYMAPEQAEGAAPTVASDWYGVGAILYEALAGRPLFSGTATDIFEAKRSLDPEPPSRVTPGAPPDLDALASALVQRNPDARPGAAEILRSLGIARREPSTAVGVAAAGPRPRSLVGRQPELAALRDALQSARTHAVTVQVVGLSGMGKSALVQEFLDEVVTRGGHLVLRGRAYERESVPYKAIDSWIDALSRHLLRLSDQSNQIPLPEGAWALARLFPVLRRVPEVADARERVLGDPHRLRRLAFGALREMFAAIAARQPLVVFVDDAHWGDADSAALLLDLVRPPDAPPLLLVMTHRHEERESVFLAALESAWPSGAERRTVVLGPLRDDDTRAFALALLGSGDATAQAAADAVAREAHGSPFLVEELVRSHQTFAAGAAAAIPLSLDQSVLARVQALPDETRHAFEIVAVSGRPLPTAMLGAAAGLEGIGQHIEILRARRFIRVGLRNGQEVAEVAHDRIAEAVVKSLAGERVSGIHGDLATVLEATPGADPESIAVHLVGAGRRDRSGPYAERAAEEAIGKLAFDRAASMFQLALAALDPDSPRASELRVRLAEALAWAGRGAQAAEVYLLEAAARPPGMRRIELERAAAEQLLASGRIDEGGQALRRILAGMGTSAPSSTASAVFWLLVYRLWLAVRGLRFTERAPEDVRQEDRVRLETTYAVAIGFALVDVLLGACLQARFLLQSLRAGDRRHVLLASSLEAAQRATLGGRVGKREQALLALSGQLAARIGDAESDVVAKGAVGVGLLLRGKWKAAREVFDASIVSPTQGLTHWQANAQIFATSTCYFTGEMQELVRRHERAIADAVERGDLYTTVNMATTTTITACLVADRPEEARRRMRAALKQWSQSGFLVQQWQAMVFDSDIDLYVGDGAAAYDRFARDQAALRRSLLLNVQFVRGLTLYAHGRCAVASIEPRPALRGQRIAEARRAAERLKRERMPWTDALASSVEAAVENGAGQRDRAVAALRETITRAEESGMAMHAITARHRLGELRGGDEGRALVDGATEQMAAEGLKNPAGWLAIFMPGRWG